MYSCYRNDLGVHFYIIETKDHNGDIGNKYCRIRGCF